MRLISTFELMELDDHVVAIPVGGSNNAYNGIIKLNETAALIFKLLKDDTTENEIISVLSEEYDASEEMLASRVHKCIELFKAKGLLTE